MFTLIKPKHMKQTHIIWLLTMILLPFAGNGQTFYHTGNEEPVETDHLPGLVLAGGATDNSDAMKWMLERANGGDVVVLRATGSDGYNNYFFTQLGVDVNSVTTIVITSPEEADNEAVINTLTNAEVVFIAGGNQWHYVDNWRETEMLTTLNNLISEKQITIGGTSAGMAVLGEVVFTAENATVWSSEALGNPYHWRVKLEKDFLDVPFMANTITDTHYNRPENDGNDRKGRHVAFMARMVADWDMPARGIAANEYTAIVVDETGVARVFGHPSYPDYAYFLQKYGGTPEVCEQGQALTWHRNGEALKVYKVKGDFEGSGWFNLENWDEGEGGEWQYWYVDEGELFETGTEDDTSISSDPPDGRAIHIYPNPAGAELNITIDHSLVTPGHNKAVVRILTYDGRIIHTLSAENTASGHSKTRTYTIHIEHLPAGIYLLEYHDGSRSRTLRWMKK
ncbi:MAG: T9SS C-terminal target domain-containing protein [Bacteroidia bacterium]|nr:MAG: T9SS C-terminal target domain-containing protein [Bacteroidia bacterium]